MINYVYIKSQKLDENTLVFNFPIFIIGTISFILGYFSITAICTLIINVVLLYKFKNKLPIFILFFYILLHTKIFIYKIIFNVQISFWDNSSDNKNIGTVLYSHLIFVFILGSVIKSKNAIFTIKNSFLNFKNKYIYWFIYAILIYIIIYGITGDTIIVTGSYSNSGDSQKSTLHEYFLLFYISLLCFSSNTRLSNFAQFIIMLIYIFKTLIYGGRIEVVQICLIYTLFVYILPGKISLKYIIMFLILGIYFSSIVSVFRNNPTVLFSSNFAEMFNPAKILEIPNKGDVISSTEGDVVQSSMRIMDLINTNTITQNERVISLFCFLISPILPQSLMPEVSNLSTYKQDYYTSGGGGLISTYFYTWLWFFGPFIIAILIGISLNKFFEFKSTSFIIYGIALLATFPRWFSYNPIFLVKLCLFAVIFFQLMKFLSVRILSKSHEK